MITSVMKLDSTVLKLILRAYLNATTIKAVNLTRFEIFSKLTRLLTMLLSKHSATVIQTEN